jgi:hypothetical protein
VWAPPEGGLEIHVRFPCQAGSAAGTAFGCGHKPLLAAGPRVGSLGV